MDGRRTGRAYRCLLGILAREIMEAADGRRAAEKALERIVVSAAQPLRKA